MRRGARAAERTISPAPRNPGPTSSAAPRTDAPTTPKSRSPRASAAEPAVSAHRNATAMPATSSRPNPRTIGTGDSSSTRKPVPVASAAVPIAGAALAAAWPTASAAEIAP